MSWFEYGTPERRSHRKGVWLRVRNLAPAILDKVQPFIPPDEKINWVIVKEIQKKGMVYIEVWCSRLDNLTTGANTGVYKSTVLGLQIQEDPAWICEGDLGRGYKE